MEYISDESEFALDLNMHAEHIYRRLGEWLVSRNGGVSSEAIAARMLGAMPNENSFPRDAGDFRRCMHLLDMIPAWRGRIQVMADVGTRWKALVDQWDDLENACRENDDTVDARIRALVN